MLAVRTQSKSSLTKQRERNRRSQQRFRERHRSTVASLQEQVSAVDEEMLLVAERIQQLSTINEVGLLECSDMPRADRKKGNITWLQLIATNWAWVEEGVIRGALECISVRTVL